MHLVLTIPDQADFTSPTEAVSWQLFDRAGQPIRDGLATLATLPASDRITALVPASRVVYIETPLPRVNAAKRLQLVNFAIEDKLTIDPATVHAVIVGELRPNGYIVAAIERAWFGRALAWLGEANISPEQVLCESELLHVAAGDWAVVLGRDYGIAKRDDGFVYTLDGGVAASPPFGLSLAMQEAAAANRAPRALVISARDGDTAIPPDTARRWAETLNCTVRTQTARQATLPTRGVNLRTASFAPTSSSSALTQRIKPALALAALLALTHAAFVFYEWRSLVAQRTALAATMTQLFKSSFPNATAIVDPPLQLARNLETLKRERGVSAKDPVRAALSQLAGLREVAPFEIRALDLAANPPTATLQGSVTNEAAKKALIAAATKLPNAALSFDLKPVATEKNIRFSLTMPVVP